MGKCGHVSDEGGKAVPAAGLCIWGKCVPSIGCGADLERARSNPHSAPLLLLSAMVQLLSSAQPGSEFSGSSSGVMDAQSAHRAVVAHGILMILAWLVFLPAGMNPFPPPPFPGYCRQLRSLHPTPGPHFLAADRSRRYQIGLRRLA